MNANENNIERFQQWLGTSITVKLLWMGFLILLLLIPNSMIQSLIFEREQRSHMAINEISSKWGGTQSVGGPVLSIPIKGIHRDLKGNNVGTYIEYAHFLPKILNITGNVKPEIRYRGIYEAVLYNVPLTISGVFETPRFSDQITADKDKEVRWADAFLSISLSDMRGIKDQVGLDWNSKKNIFNPGIPTQDIFNVGLSIPVEIPVKAKDKEIPFQIQLNLNGSQSLSFLPMGKTTRVQLKSNWNSPSFVGDFLPEKREVTADGFEAAWTVLHFNRNYPQEWIGKSHEVLKPDFGVELFRSVDQYQKTTRSAKYAVLFLFLTFLVFFLVEIFGKHPLHTIQYMLVGFAMCLFYLLLLLLSEHLPFWGAYCVASLTVVALVTGYSKGVFNKKIITGVVFGTVMCLYGFLYSLLQMEDYSLLIGTLALTAILGSVMYFTRKLNWSSLNAKEKSNQEGSNNE